MLQRGNGFVGAADARSIASGQGAGGILRIAVRPAWLATADSSVSVIGFGDNCKNYRRNP
jgi:hypothetical protein